MLAERFSPILAVICVWTASNCSGAIFRQYDLPELVCESPLIASGQIALSNGVPILSVGEILKGRTSFTRLNILSTSLGDMPAVSFTNKENVLLFLDEPRADGSTILFGGGDQGKWPRGPDSGGFSPVLSRASSEEIVCAVRDLVRINEMEGAESKSEKILEWLTTSDKIKQLLAIQYLSDDLLWPRDQHSGKISASANERRKTIDHFIGNLSQLAQSDEVSIRRDAIRALRFAPPDLVMPVIEKAGSDTNESVRSAVREVLTSMPEVPASVP